MERQARRVVALGNAGKDNAGGPNLRRVTKTNPKTLCGQKRLAGQAFAGSRKIRSRWSTHSGPRRRGCPIQYLRISFPTSVALLPPHISLANACIASSRVAAPWVSGLQPWPRAHIQGHPGGCDQHYTAADISISKITSEYSSLRRPVRLSERVGHSLRQFLETAQVARGLRQALRRSLPMPGSSRKIRAPTGARQGPRIINSACSRA